MKQNKHLSLGFQREMPVDKETESEGEGTYEEQGDDGD